jgi:hypothetical protein
MQQDLVWGRSARSKELATWRVWYSSMLHRLMFLSAMPLYKHCLANIFFPSWLKLCSWCASGKNDEIGHLSQWFFSSNLAIVKLLRQPNFKNVSCSINVVMESCWSRSICWMDIQTILPNIRLNLNLMNVRLGEVGKIMSSKKRWNHQ